MIDEIRNVGLPLKRLLFRIVILFPMKKFTIKKYAIIEKIIIYVKLIQSRLSQVSTVVLKMSDLLTFYFDFDFLKARICMLLRKILISIIFPFEQLAFFVTFQIKLL